MTVLQNTYLHACSHTVFVFQNATILNSKQLSSEEFEPIVGSNFHYIVLFMSNPFNFERELKFYLWIFQALGLQQFSIDGISKGIKAKKRSNGFIVYFVVQISILIFFLVIIEYYFPVKISNKISVGTAISVLLKFFGNVIYLAQTISLLLLALINANSQYKVFICFHQIMQQFHQKLQTTIDYSKFRRTYLVCGSFFVVIFLVESIIESYHYRIANSNALIVLIHIVAVIVNLINHFSGFVYGFYVQLFNFHVKHLRENLEKLIELKNDSPVIYQPMSLVEPSSTYKDSPHFINQFSSIKAIHLSLWEVFTMVDQCNGKTISLFLFELAFTLVNSGYLLFVELVTDSIRENIIHNVVIMFCYFLYLLVIVHSSEGPSYEVGKTSVRE